MVKGTSRRVIVVDSPDTELFEQAIFIVRNDILSDRGVTAQMLVDEACRVARSCTRRGAKKQRRISRGDAVHWGILVAFVASLAWLAAVLV
ncbi:MAG: translation initiation factor 2 [Oscillospiraceae bacterium]|nr:translation initiation factor 2 [Oscillospiraceae bacterium]